MFFTATYLANRMPHFALQTPTPLTVLFGLHDKLDHLRAIEARAFVHIETHTRNLGDKAWKGRLCDYSMSTKAYRIYNPDTRRVKESRNDICIETPVSTLIDPYISNNKDDAGDPQEDSSSSGNPADISITDHDEVPRLLRKLLDLTTKDFKTSNIQKASTPGNSTKRETPPFGANGSISSPDTITTGAQPTGSEQGGATRMRTRANGAVAPISHEGLNAHRRRELRNLVLLANPVECDEDEAHEMENLVEYRLGSQDGTPTRWSSRAHDGNPSRIRFGHQQPPFRAQFGWGGDSYSEHVQGGDGITASSQTERGVRQRDGEPRKSRGNRLKCLRLQFLRRRRSSGRNGCSRPKPTTN